VFEAVERRAEVEALEQGGGGWIHPFPGNSMFPTKRSLKSARAESSR
jgi:hypothetical protein